MGVSNPGAALPTLPNFPLGAGIYGQLTVPDGVTAYVQPAAGSTWCITQTALYSNTPDLLVTDGVRDSIWQRYDRTQVSQTKAISPFTRKRRFFATHSTYFKCVAAGATLKFAYSGYLIFGSHAPPPPPGPDIWYDNLVGVSRVGTDFKRAGVSVGLTDPWSHSSVIDDPTGGGKGRCISIVYGGAWNDDAVGMSDAYKAAHGFVTADPSEEWWVNWDSYDDDQPWMAAGGKWEQLMAAAGIQAVLGIDSHIPGPNSGPIYGTLIVNDGTFFNTAGPGSLYSLFRGDGTYDTVGPLTIVQHQWYNVKRRIKNNSGVGIADGEYEVRVDGVVRLLILAIPWIKLNNGNTLPLDFFVGKQVNGGAGPYTRLIANLKSSHFAIP